MRKPIWNKIDYTNKKIANWTILSYGSCTRKLKSKNYNVTWICQCSCGITTEVNKYNLVSGRSTGCSNCTGKRHSKDNNPNWKGYNNISGEVFRRILFGASVRDIKVEITIEDLDSLWKESKFRCALSNLPIELKSSASLDRIDSSLGYTKDNIQWVHKDINLMKNKFNEVDFIELCILVADNNRRSA